MSGPHGPRSPVAWLGLAVGGMLIALLAWQWPFTINAVRALASRPAHVEPNATARFPVLERVAGAPAPLPGDGPADEARRFAAALDYAQRMQSYSLLIWQGGRLRFERYLNGTSRDTRAESASMHKSVMAMVVGHALADGRLASLDDPIGRYVEEWAEDPRGRITLRQLLQMSTGLANASDVGGLLSERSRFQLGLFPVQVLLHLRQQRPPGTLFEYANVNSNLMGLVLSRALGERYSEYLSRKIWQPLGAADAFVSPDRPGGFVKTASSLLATPRDWLRLGIALAGDGVFDGRRVLPPGWVDRMVAPSPRNPNYGLQIWRAAPHAPKRYYSGLRTGPYVPAASPFLAPDMVFFDGWGGQRVYVSTAEQVVIVHTGPERLDWDDAELPNRVLRALRAPDRTAAGTP